MSRLMIVVGSVRPGRIGLPIADWVREQAEADGRFEVDFVDLAELNLPFMDEPNHPRLRQYTKQHTLDWSARVEAADAFIFVTPEYNYSYAPALKNAVDFVFQEWSRKPLAFVSYGGVSGGTRGVVALGTTVTAVGLVVVQPKVEIPFAVKQLGDDGRFEANEHQEKTLAAALAEIAALDVALRPVRPLPRA
ncbi:NAD(P)H-dependent oxidoreductase [Microbacterium sp. STN6]|uniref:NADPH-dependent FMN reductase n=1 Tax=Microbacterium sp. STN6 TaxID=2995588 RepID=UPI002260AAD9|nr:NAD(P)H-dependent oxidoreductase [Microbacterium sp. STN6]MCX7521731.1 NAD(P)H-dependent oxidoreductase [Microbacterium sp. STN6]